MDKICKPWRLLKATINQEISGELGKILKGYTVVYSTTYSDGCKYILIEHPEASSVIEFDDLSCTNQLPRKETDLRNGR